MKGEPRGLAVLADGCHAAFTAGAVAELARRGCHWDVVLGAGTGAQVAVLAALGEAEEAARRWQRQGELGCPLLAPLAEALQRRLEGLDGGIALLDPWRLSGWLDPATLAEHLAPEAAAVPARLRERGTQAMVLTMAMERGKLAWENLRELEVGAAWDALAGACCFPAGWGAHRSADGERRWGGVGLLVGAPLDVVGWAAWWEVVCGFPVPAVPRDWVSRSLFEQVQRRDEILAAYAVARWLREGGEGRFSLFAPTPAIWCQVEGRGDAELGVEYPLPWERNGELVRRLLAAGVAAVEGWFGKAGQ